MSTSSIKEPGIINLQSLADAYNSSLSGSVNNTLYGEYSENTGIVTLSNTSPVWVPAPYYSSIIYDPPSLNAPTSVKRYEYAIFELAFRINPTDLYISKLIYIESKNRPNKELARQALFSLAREVDNKSLNYLEITLFIQRGTASLDKQIINQGSILDA